MSQLSRHVLAAICLGTSLSAFAADLVLTIQRGDEVRSFSKLLVADQAIVVDERRKLAVRPAEGCFGFDTSKLDTTVEVGLLVTIDYIQKIGDAVMVRVGLNEVSFDGTRFHELRPDCVLQLPRTTSVNVGPNLAILPMSGKSPTLVFRSHSSVVGQDISLSLQVR